MSPYDRRASSARRARILRSTSFTRRSVARRRSHVRRAHRHNSWMRKLAAVLFDEAHSEAWTIRPDVARAIQPSHPGDSSFAAAAAALRERDFTVASHID